MAEDRAEDDILECRLAVMDADGLRVVMNGAPGLAGSGWQQQADAWAARMEVGDELWTWSTPAWTWQNLCGRAGLAIVRAGRTVELSMTVMN